jgi:hypothetical protein
VCNTIAAALCLTMFMAFRTELELAEFEELVARVSMEKRGEQVEQVRTEIVILNGRILSTRGSH